MESGRYIRVFANASRSRYRGITAFRGKSFEGFSVVKKENKSAFAVSTTELILLTVSAPKRRAGRNGKGQSLYETLTEAALVLAADGRHCSGALSCLATLVKSTICSYHRFREGSFSWRRWPRSLRLPVDGLHSAE